MRTVLAGIIAVALGATCFAQEKKEAPKAEAGPSVEVVGVSVGKRTPDGKAGLPYHTGTELTLVIVDEDKEFVGGDEESKIVSFKDNLGTDLTKGRNPAGISTLQLFTADRHGCMSFARSEVAPAKGATEIALKANVVMRYGRGLKEFHIQDMALKEGSSFNVGTVARRIKEVELDEKLEYQMTVTLIGESDNDLIKEIEFLSPGGEVIESRKNAWGWSRDDHGKKVFEMTVQLKKVVPTVTIRGTCYEKMEKVSIPVDVRVGLGL